MDPTVYEDLKTVLGNVERNVLLKALVRFAIKEGDLEREPRVPKAKPAHAIWRGVGRVRWRADLGRGLHARWRPHRPDAIIRGDPRSEVSIRDLTGLLPNGRSPHG